jgi:hypothetical protein
MKKILFACMLCCLGLNLALAQTGPRQIWPLPSAVTREPILDQVRWQGQPVRAETLQIPISFEQFAVEFARLIPEHALVTSSAGALLFQWVHENISYLLLLDKHTDFSTGILSSVSLIRNVPALHAPALCTNDWIPGTLKPLFSMGDSVRAGLASRVVAYVSDQPVDLIRPLIMRSLKRAGWIVIPNPTLVDRTHSKFTVDAYCGLARMSVAVHRDVMQTHILVMRVEQ